MDFDGVCATPTLDWSVLHEHVRQNYTGVAGDTTATWRSLSGERDQNVLIDERFVVKVFGGDVPRSHAECQALALEHVRRVSLRGGTELAAAVPVVVATTSGQLVSECRASEARHAVLVLGYIAGVTLHGSGFLDWERDGFDERVRGLGRLLGLLTRSLRGFVHAVPASRRLLWDVMQADRFLPLLNDDGDEALVADAQRRRQAVQLLRELDERVRPQLAELRAQIVHADVHPHNVIVDEASLALRGIIDFGDMCQQPMICDVANCLADTLDASPVPFERLAVPLLRGYVSVVPLEEDECSALFDLLSLRLLSTHLALAAKRRALGPSSAAAAVAGQFGQQVWQRLDELAARRQQYTDLIRRAALYPPAADSVDADTASMLARRRHVLGERLRLFYSPLPCHMVRGDGVWLFDAAGRRYLDLYNNVVSVGHCHPYVVEAVVRQCRTLNTNTRYLTAGAVRYAERLLATQHPSLDRVLFVNSGSEANDLAYRIAKACTGRTGGLAVEFAYHGITDALDGFTPSNFRPERSTPRPAHVRYVPPPDRYRGPYRADDADAGRRYAALVDEHIAALDADGHGLACAMFDSMFMSNGVLEAPDDYLRLVAERVRASGGLYVADEVQSGFGRTGTHLWGYQKHGVVPDLVTIGKPAGNGYPVGAVITRSDILARFTDSTSFFSTFGGNNVACAAGIAVLDVVRDERLVDNCRRVGAHLKHGLQQLMLRHPIVGDVRGFGLAIGVELVRDRATQQPATDETQQIVRLIRDHGCLVGSEGTADNCIKVRPPLTITIEQADVAVAAFDAALRQFTLAQQSEEN